MKRLLTCSLLLAVAACQREAPPTQGRPGQAAQETPAAQAPAAAAPAPLQDVIERTPNYVIGISFPKDIDQYPGLAAELRRYADAARAELKQAVDGLGGEKPRAPYDLSLAFTTIVRTPRIVTVSAEGSSYTGGAHGNPLVARFVWLPQERRLLEIEDLIADPDGWRDISGYVREQLHAAVSLRIDADDMPPDDRAELMESALQMIDEGSAPEAANFSEFEPVLDAAGRITALRFVFPPYQVGPYSDGVQSVEVPAAVLLPHVAAPYRDLFVRG